MKWLSISCTCLLASCAVTASGGGQQVTPQRPTLTNSTSTTVEGTLELEAGGQWDPGDTFLTPTTVKYGAGPKTEVYLGWVPVVYDGGVTTIGPTQFGIRHRYYDGGGSAPSAAVQVSVDMPTGNSRLTSGETVTSFAGMVTGNAELWTFTGYGSFDVVGDPNDKGVDPGFSLAFLGSRPIKNRWSGYGELAGRFVPNQDYDPIFSYIGASYAVAEWLAFDLGFLVGYNKDAPDFAFTFGLTRNFGRLSRYVSS